MTVDLDGPADTSMMRIVHQAFRRDFARAQVVLAQTPQPEDGQRIALADHLEWMMLVLHRHHEAEDDHLYPMVRERNAAAGALLDSMDADHQQIIPAMAALERAAAAYRMSADARSVTSSALDALADVLLPHLVREEAEMMPVVSTTITEREWRDWDQTYNVKCLSKSELADVGLWIMDELGDDDRRVVEQLVPPVPRFIISKILIRGYRKAAFRRWRLPEHSGLKARLSGQVEATVPAPPEAIWNILTDVTRIGEWSHECRSAVWLDGANRAAVGARFRGRNKSGLVRWSRPCLITTCEPIRELAYRTSGGVYGDCTQWRFQLESSAAGTRVIQSFQVVSLPVWFDRFLWLVVPAHHDRMAALRADLDSLGRLAAVETPALPKTPIVDQAPKDHVLR